MAWRYLVFAEPSRTYLGEIRLTGPEVTRVLSGPGRLTGKLAPGQSADILEPWAVSVWAEDEAGRIRGGGFLTPMAYDETGPSIDCIGFSGYPQGMPWVDDRREWIQADPLDIVRAIWAHLQAQPGGNIGVTIDSTRSPVRIGTPEPEEDELDATVDTSEEGPFTLDWWSDFDLGKVIDDLAEQTPFDYLEHDEWSGDRIAHRIQLGHPTIGSRRADLRFELGVNVTATPALTADDDAFASEVHALGAGEGQAMVRASLTRDTTGVRRVTTYSDKTARSKSALTAAARADLGWHDGSARIEQLQVTDHVNARLASLEVGDQILIEGTTQWQALDRWVRVVEIALKPGDPTATITVQEV